MTSRNVHLLFVAASVLAVPTSMAADWPADADVRVTLTGALQRGAGDAAVRADLELTLFRREGKWQPDVCGFAREYNLAFHAGRLDGADDGERLAASVRITIHRDGSIYGGPAGGEGLADCSLQLRREGNRLAGTYAGTFTPTIRGVARDDADAYPIRGRAVGTIEPPWPPRVEARKPLGRGEHPRLLFRREDLPALKERADTPQGRKIIAYMRKLLALDRGGFGWTGCYERCAPAYVEGAWAAGHGFLYVLTGEKAQAARAKRITELALRRNSGEWGSWGNAFRKAYAAIAYDLCCDAWDDDFRREVVAFLASAAEGRNDRTDMHFAAMYQSAGALAALAILDDPAPEPARPLGPARAAALPAESGFRPGEGVPVVTFASGSVPGEWLTAGLFARGGPDPLAALGGRHKARPDAETAIDRGGRKVAFFPLKCRGAISLYGFTRDQRVIPLEDGKDECRPVCAYFHTVVRNDRPRVVRAAVNPRGAFHGPPRHTAGVSMWLAGRRVRDGDVLRLAEGLYPMLVEVPVDEAIQARPHLVEYDEAAYRAAVERWRRTRDAWQRAGGTVPYAAERLRRNLHFLRHYMRFSMGEWGFPREGSNWTDAWHNLLPLDHACRTALGADLSASPEGRGLKRVIPLQAAAGRFWHCDWGSEFWRAMGFAALVPAEHRPMLRWYMDEALALLDGGRRNPMMTTPAHCIFALMNYPFEVEARPAKELSLPRFVADERLGGYVFRSGWDERSDFALVVQLQADAPRTSVTAGDYSIFGRRGRTRWTGMTTAGGGFFRPPCLTSVERPNVVRIEGAIPTRGARLVDVRHEKDGSGAISLVQDYWVRGSADNGFGSPKVDDPANLGIETLRAVAADFSGTSGAPALFVVADRISGAGRRKVWLQMNYTHGRGGTNDRLVVDGCRFRIVPPTRRGEKSEPKPTLAGTLISAAGEKLGLALWGKKRVQVEGRWRNVPAVTAVEKGEFKRYSGLLVAQPADDARPGPAGTKLYFLVLTIQEGDPPAVSVEGTGRDAKITVGKQTIRLAGDRLLLGR
jgi:hypothetical protein